MSTTASTRSLEPLVVADLEKKMVFVAGPRQVGKTTLSRSILNRHGSGAYLNFDRSDDRKVARRAQWPPGNALVVLDELHKQRGWKRWLKGEYDAHRDRLRFLVTGSARLDVFRRGSDSLLGRYHHYRLHPFSLAEVGNHVRRLPDRAGGELEFDRLGDANAYVTLLRFGGFPEPFLADSERTWRRWRTERTDRLLREDVRDLESVENLSSIETLIDLLAERVASPLSLNSLREDLELSHRAIVHRLATLEHLYLVYRVPPYAHRAVRALKKMPKLYFWDWSEVTAEGPRFENAIASHLLKFCHFLTDAHGFAVELRYVRDHTGRECDFLVLLDRKPWFLVEAKLSASDLDPSLRYFKDRLKVPFAYQITRDGDADYEKHGMRSMPGRRFLAALV